MRLSSICFLSVFCLASYGVQFIFYFVSASCQHIRSVWSLVQRFPSKVLKASFNWCGSNLLPYIWKSRNVVIFKSTAPNNALQVLFRTTYWIKEWCLQIKRAMHKRGLSSTGSHCFDKLPQFLAEPWKQNQFQVLAVWLVKLSLVSRLDALVCGGLRTVVNLVIGGCKHSLVLYRKRNRLIPICI